MKTLALILLGFIALIFLGLCVLRLLDKRADRAETARLVALQPDHPQRFTPAMVQDLPEPVRRYFTYTISEGTPLYTVAQIEMTGSFGLGTRQNPNYMEMAATQILASPHGFIWKMSGGSGLMQISGSDSGNWTRFRIAGLVPVARAGNTPDHGLSSFGRHVSEATFWTPAALLPGPGIAWEAISENEIRVTVTHGALSQSVALVIGPDGAPSSVTLQRWSNANAQKAFQRQPFGGELSLFRTFNGFRLPTHVEGGHFVGTTDYFPFFIAEVRNISFPITPDAD